MDLCMIVAMYAQDIDAGLLYALGYRTALTTDTNGEFENINTLSRIILKNKDGDETLVKSVMNGDDAFHAFLLEDRTVRVVKEDESTFDITLESEIIAINSDNTADSLFIIDSKMRAYEIKDKTPVRVTGLSDGIKIKDISCGYKFTVFLSECGRVFGMGSNGNVRLGLPDRIEKTEIPTEITFPNQSDSDKDKIIIEMINAAEYGWVAADSKQRMWIVGDTLMEYICSDYESMYPYIGIIEMWYSNNIRIVQTKCGREHVIALDTEGRVYWFGVFNASMPMSCVSLDPIPFSHQIIDIRSGFNSVACKDATNEWYIWGYDSDNHITGLCGCETICKETKKDDVISKPMKCEWSGMFDSTRVIDLQLGYYKVHVIVNIV